MKPFRIVSCGQDDVRWDDYFLLLMENYAELTLPYGFRVAFSFIGDPIIQGDALLVRDGCGRTVGALGFVFQGEGNRVCQVEAVFLREEARDAATFYRLLQAFSTYLAEQTPETVTIQFWSPADRPDLRNMFERCCRFIKTNEKDFGRIDLFETSSERLEQFTSRWRGVRHA